MRLVNNRGSDRVIDQFNRATVSSGSVSIAAATLSLPGLSALVERLQGSESVRLILSPVRAMADDVQGSEADRRRRNGLLLRHMAVSLASWLTKVEARQARSRLPQSLLVVDRGTSSLAISGACDPTTHGLGLAPALLSSLIQLTTTKDEAQLLRGWFEEQWSTLTPSPHDQHALQTELDRFSARRTAGQVHGRVLQSLFAEMGEALDEHQIVKSATGIRDTVVWSKLYRFQRDGVLGAIDKLQRFGGCILADSVGLGKTFEALAVIKYHELRNDRVLVLVPKRLRDNWTLPKANDRRNVLSADRFGYDVLNHTDLSRDGGLSGDIDLGHVNWGNYDLVVIDESHNFRNRATPKDHETRYDRLMRAVIKAGVKTRVLMLSATPVNNRLSDLKNQVAFATEGDDAVLRGEGIASIAATIRVAQGQFNRWLELSEARRSSERLLEMLGFDYVRLLDLLTIARSRKHVERYYGTEETGRFPERRPPINVKADVDLQGAFPPIGTINDEIRRLTLAAYAPLRYVLSSRQAAYDRAYSQQVRGGESVFRQADREESMVNLLRVGLLKRMESSVAAFALTVERQIATVEATLARVEAHEPSIDEPSIEDIELDDPLLEFLGVGRNVRVLLADVDGVRWAADLCEDRARLRALLEHARRVTPDRDAKLEALRELIAEKQGRPFNAGNRKVLVFTAFADTARYLYEALADQPGRHAALVTGGGGNRSTLKGLRSDLASILAAFAPRAKGRPAEMEGEGELDLLIATDVISEGQNLQDCDCVVNYDIHWNPVRIVQRFGRVDRIGSPNREIQLVNFWPNMDLDNYIDLERRVSGRMMLLDVSATGEENLIEAQPGDAMNDVGYRRRQLEAMQDHVIDLEDLSAGVSIADLTLNDLRMDLARLSQEEREELGRMPLTAHAVVRANEDVDPGAIFCLRAETPRALSALDSADPLRPHALVHVGEDGAVLLGPSQAKRILDRTRALAQRGSALNEEAWDAFDRQTRVGSRMERWCALLEAAIAAVSGKGEERAVDSLFSAGPVVDAGGGGGLDDWEVVAWIAILPRQTPGA